MVRLPQQENRPTLIGHLPFLPGGSTESRDSKPRQPHRLTRSPSMNRPTSTALSMTMWTTRTRHGAFIALWLAITVASMSDESAAFSVPSRSAVPVRPVAFCFARTSMCRTFSTTRTTSLPESSPPRVERDESSLFRAKRETNSLRRRSSSSSTTTTSRLFHRLRRAVAVLWTIALLWVGGTVIHSRPCHATMTSSDVMSRVIPKGASFDKIVDRYVRDHMFNNDVYDPVESAYREAYDDVTTGAYPRALKETTTSILGQQVVKADSSVQGSGGLAGILAKGSTFLQSMGASPMVANSVMYVGSLLGLPFLALLGGLSYANAEKRRLNRLNKKRYGDDYSVDASSKIEEDIEAPDDDDEDDDDDDDADDDEDDDDE